MSFITCSTNDGQAYNWRLAKILAWIILGLLCLLAIASYSLVRDYGFGNVTHAVVVCPVNRLTALVYNIGNSYSSCIAGYLR